jgi:hypothetical protein
MKPWEIEGKVSDSRERIINLLRVAIENEERLLDLTGQGGDLDDRLHKIFVKHHDQYAELADSYDSYREEKGGSPDMRKLVLEKLEEIFDAAEALSNNIDELFTDVDNEEYGSSCE